MEQSQTDGVYFVVVATINLRDDWSANSGLSRLFLTITLRDDQPANGNERQLVKEFNATLDWASTVSNPPPGLIRGTRPAAAGAGPVANGGGAQLVLP